MIKIISILGCILFLVLAFAVGGLRKINVAPSIKESQLKKVRKKDIFIRDVAVHLFIMGIAFLAPLLLGKIIGRIGEYIGLAILVIVALVWSFFIKNLDENIKRGKY